VDGKLTTGSRDRHSVGVINVHVANALQHQLLAAA